MATSTEIAEVAVVVRPRLLALSAYYCSRSDCYNEVEDLVEDTIVSAMVSSHTFKEGSIEVWLTTILKNKWRTFLRKRKVRNESFFPLLPSHLLCSSEEEVTANLDMKQALDSIPNLELRECLELSLEGYSINEISNMLGLPEGTVKSRCARARVYAVHRSIGGHH